jgi:hypothetical protein
LMLSSIKGAITLERGIGSGLEMTVSPFLLAINIIDKNISIMLS